MAQVVSARVCVLFFKGSLPLIKYVRLIVIIRSPSIFEEEEITPFLMNGVGSCLKLLTYPSSGCLIGIHWA